MTQRLRLADAPDVMDVKTFAAILGIGKNSAYQAVADGLIYSCRIGKSVRIPKIAVERFLLGPHSNENGFEAIIPGAVHLESSISALPPSG